MEDLGFLDVPCDPASVAFEGTLPGPSLRSCRSVDLYERLNRIEEGSYGIVYRARDRATGDIVALKRVKLDVEVNGFPITCLREIQTLLLSKHPNIVDVREIVVTPNFSGYAIAFDANSMLLKKVQYFHRHGVR